MRRSANWVSNSLDFDFTSVCCLFFVSKKRQSQNHIALCPPVCKYITFELNIFFFSWIGTIGCLHIIFLFYCDFLLLLVCVSLFRQANVHPIFFFISHFHWIFSAVFLCGVHNHTHTHSNTHIHKWESRCVSLFKNFSAALRFFSIDFALWNRILSLNVLLWQYNYSRLLARGEWDENNFVFRFSLSNGKKSPICMNSFNPNRKTNSFLIRRITCYMKNLPSTRVNLFLFLFCSVVCRLTYVNNFNHKYLNSIALIKHIHLKKPPKKN